MIDELKQRWLELGRIPSSHLTIVQVTEQFHLAQTLTALLSPILYDHLNAHRAECVKLLRKGELHSGSKYSIMSPNKPRKHLSWREIEITPDITFTLSDEFVGSIIPAKYVRVLKKMIQQQGSLLLQLEG